MQKSSTWCIIDAGDWRHLRDRHQMSLSDKLSFAYMAAITLTLPLGGKDRMAYNVRAPKRDSCYTFHGPHEWKK